MAEIYYIGGSPCSGKSTIAEMLVAKYGFQYYKQDDYLGDYISRGTREGNELFKKVSLMSTEEMWMRSPVEQCSEEIALYDVMLSYSANDLLTLSPNTPIIAEGAGFMPSYAKRMSIDKSHYICIVPTREFQVSTYSQRSWVSQYLSDCSDKGKAFENWMERDALFAKAVIQEAESLQYKYLIVDGSKNIEENFASVEGVFNLRIL